MCLPSGLHEICSIVDAPNLGLNCFKFLSTCHKTSTLSSPPDSKNSPEEEKMMFAKGDLYYSSDLRENTF